jgi:hypothetical protein
MTNTYDPSYSSPEKEENHYTMCSKLHPIIKYMKRIGCHLGHNLTVQERFSLATSSTPVDMDAFFPPVQDIRLTDWIVLCLIFSYCKVL